MDSAVPGRRVGKIAAVAWQVSTAMARRKKGHPQVPFLTALVLSQIRTSDAGRIAGRTV